MKIKIKKIMLGIILQKSLIFRNKKYLKRPSLKTFKQDGCNQLQFKDLEYRPKLLFIPYLI